MVHCLCRRLRLLFNKRLDTVSDRPFRFARVAGRICNSSFGVQINDRIERINADTRRYLEAELLSGTNVGIEIDSAF